MDARPESPAGSSKIGGFSAERDLFSFVASKRESLSAAFRLVYDSYLRRGLVQANRPGLRILPHQLQDTSWVLLAARDGELLGTLSVIEDGELALPIESLYLAEMARLRYQSARVAELTCLATKEHLARTQSAQVLRELLTSAIQLSHHRQIDGLTICVHPRHARFYRERLGFSEFGPSRRCPWVCDQPAVAMILWLDGQPTTPRNRSNGRPLVLPPEIEPRSALPACREYFQCLFDEVSPIPYLDRRAGAA
jgi:N-acyl amino acid synthase FeeM